MKRLNVIFVKQTCLETFGHIEAIVICIVYMYLHDCIQYLEALICYCDWEMVADLKRVENSW